MPEPERVVRNAIPNLRLFTPGTGTIMKPVLSAILSTATCALLGGGGTPATADPPPKRYPRAAAETFKVRSLVVNGYDVTRGGKATIAPGEIIKIKGRVEFPLGRPDRVSFQVVDDAPGKPLIWAGETILLDVAEYGKPGVAAFVTARPNAIPKPGTYRLLLLAPPYPRPAPGEDARNRLLVSRELVVSDGPGQSL